MKKIIILASIFMIICVSEGFALVVTNKCETCSYIDLDLNGYSDEGTYEYYDGHLGGYDTSLAWPVPAGEYDFHGLCESGESKGFVWIDSLTLTGSLLEDQHNLYCPSQTTTTTSTPITTTTARTFPCPSEALYGEDSEEAKLLRFLRDIVLNTTPEGQELIKLYYQWSPAIVKAMEEDEEFKQDVKEMIDGVLELIGNEME
jgi:hypothetical protein